MTTRSSFLVRRSPVFWSGMNIDMRWIWGWDPTLKRSCKPRRRQFPSPEFRRLGLSLVLQIHRCLDHTVFPSSTATPSSSLFLPGKLSSALYIACFFKPLLTRHSNTNRGLGYSSFIPSFIPSKHEGDKYSFPDTTKKVFLFQEIEGVWAVCMLTKDERTACTFDDVGDFETRELDNHHNRRNLVMVKYLEEVLGVKHVKLLMGAVYCL